MELLSKELSDPIHFLNKFRSLDLSYDNLAGWSNIADKFELVALSPTYNPIAKKLSEYIAETINFLIDKRKSDFKYPITITEYIIYEDDPTESINSETFETEELPNFSMVEHVRKLSDEDKKRIWSNFCLMLNRFKEICNSLGHIFDFSLSEDFIKGLVYLEIDNKPFIDYSSRDNLYRALSGEIPQTDYPSLKILLPIYVGETSYILDRLNKSGHIPILEKLISGGAFWKSKVFDLIESRKERNRFIKDDKKIILKTEIDEKIDQLLSKI
jgi:hypothetical protein